MRHTAFEHEVVTFHKRNDQTLQPISWGDILGFFRDRQSFADIKKNIPELNDRHIGIACRYFEIAYPKEFRLLNEYSLRTQVERNLGMIGKRGQAPNLTRIYHYTDSLDDSGAHINGSVSMASLMLRMKMGQRFKDIKSDFPNIPTERLLAARALLSVYYPAIYRDVDGKIDMKVLVDENLDPHWTLDGLKKIFREVHHVRDVGLQGRPDIEVWAHATQGGYDLIFTKDQASVQSRDKIDLTRCAELRWKWHAHANNGIIADDFNPPRIVHMKMVQEHGRKVRVAIYAQKGALVEVFHERVSPVIELHANSVKPGIHIFELLFGGYSNLLKELRNARLQKIVHDLELEQNLDEMQLRSTRASLKRILEKEILTEMAHCQTHHERVEYACSQIKAIDDYQFSDFLTLHATNTPGTGKLSWTGITLQERLQRYKAEKRLNVA